jgi:proteasome-associated ATPase
MLQGDTSGTGVRIVRRGGGHTADGFAAMLACMGGGMSFFEPAKTIELSGTISVDSPEAPKPGVAWDAVKGQDEAKQALREAVELPLQFPGIYKAYGKTFTRGALLYGPPGCGKTMLGKALCATLGTGAAGFLYVKGGEIFSRYVGDEQKAIGEHFEKARRFKAHTGKPMVIFYDEADAVFQDRSEGNGDGEHSSRNQAISRFLAEIDGLEDSGAFVVLATNRPEVIDPAVLREGRCDRKVRVARPSKEVVVDIARAGFASTPKGVEADFAQLLADAVWSPKRTHYRCETEDYGTIAVQYHHQVSGAVVAGIVERAVSAALQRDILAGRTEPSGLLVQDVEDAVQASFMATTGLSLSWLIAEVLDGKMPTKIHALHGRPLQVGGKAPELKITHEIKEDRGW